MDETLVYEVSKKDIVKPEETDIKIESGDKLSLVTCYPYGINSHRLIVTAERSISSSTNDEIGANNHIKEQTQFNIRSDEIILSIIAILIVFVVIAIAKWRTK